MKSRMEPAACTIDGFGPLPMIRPAGVAELGDIVRRAAAEKQAIYPVGGGTELGLGNPPTKPGVAVDMRGLDQVIDFPARDMTITVQAGITIAKLQALLAPENLRLPIDVPEPERATLGGILATNVSGPRRYGYGTLRDYVIGISAVNDGGNEFKAGGRVVKNVAGYDLCKLLVGSLGTLGIITQVTLKLRPLPEEVALVTLGCETGDLAATLDRLHVSRTRPICVELLNQPAANRLLAQAGMSRPEAAWVAVVGYEGNADAVNWQVQQLVKELGAGRSLDVRVGAPSLTLWYSLFNWQSSAQPKVLLKVNVFPSVVAATCVAANGLSPQPLIQAHAGNGIIHLAYELLDDQSGFANAIPTGAALKGTMDSLPRDSGNVTAVKLPSEWKSIVSVWGRAPADLWLMKQVKHRFDPSGLFNPGRFVGGI
jgi:glycolate oxidase FAD binding subunit